MFKIMLKIFRYLKGYIRISVESDKIERLINMFKNLGIELWDMEERRNDIFEFYILVSDFKRSRRLFKKSNSKWKIIGRYGLPFILFKNRHKKLLFLGVITSFCIIYYMSGFIWTINISGNYSYTYSELTDVLDDIGIKNGIKKKLVNGEEIEKYLRNKYFDINWVSVEIKGTIMNINIKENFDAFINEDIKNPCHIVATRDGVINSIVTRNGVPMVKAGDTVKKGDILISGTIIVFDDFGEILSTRNEVADGDIYIDTVYEYKDIINREYDKKIYSGNEKSQLFINISDKLLCIKAGKVKYKEYDIITEEVPLSVGENFDLPAGIYIRKIKEVNIVKELYSDEQLNDIYEKNLKVFTDNLENNGATAIDCNIQITNQEDKYVAEGLINVTEPAVKYQDIS